MLYNHFRWVVFVSVKKTYEQYMKLYYMRISHMRVKWNEICYIAILRRLGGFGTNISHKNFAKYEIVAQERVFVC